MTRNGTFVDRIGPRVGGIGRGVGEDGIRLVAADTGPVETVRQVVDLLDLFMIVLMPERSPEKHERILAQTHPVDQNRVVSRPVVV